MACRPFLPRGRPGHRRPLARSTRCAARGARPQGGGARSGQAVRVAVHAGADEEHARDHDVQRHAGQRAASSAPRCSTRSSSASSAGMKGGLSEAIMRSSSGRWACRRARSRPHADQRQQPRRSRWTGCRQPTRRSREGRRRLRAAAHRRRAKAEPPPASRRPSWWRRRRTRPAGAARRSARRRHAGAQPVRHQGRAAAGPARWPRSPPPSTSAAGAQGDGQVPRLQQLRRVVRRLRQADEGQPALCWGRRQWWPGAADASAFAQGLQKAGYATDPAYADKLTRVINTTLRLQRSMA
jgi:hypothetical protein